MYRFLLYFTSLILVLGNVHADTSTRQKRVQEADDVGSYRWILDTASGARFQLVQRVPDQTRSFYNSRGFPLEAADRYAVACVMQTIFNNNSDHVISFDLKDWRIVHNGQSRPLKLTSQWQQEWEARGVPQAARIAFQWSQFPNTQRHDPGDWFQGMIAAELAPLEKFDLDIKWTEDGAARTATLRDIQCAEDRNLIGDNT